MQSGTNNKICQGRPQGNIIKIITMGKGTGGLVIRRFIYLLLFVRGVLLT